ncbi:hypothetical protein AB0D94_02560 [Streptomyces sp. NPDC048255]|uniref:hypothetical protein n=1 Tax=Streptomyces sp. NPDC048255 TaxID=3154713 RepID=UPI0033D186CB
MEESLQLARAARSEATRGRPSTPTYRYRPSAGRWHGNGSTAVLRLAGGGQREGHAEAVADDEQDAEECPAQRDGTQQDDEGRRAGHQTGRESYAEERGEAGAARPLRLMGVGLVRVVAKAVAV